MRDHLSYPLNWRIKTLHILNEMTGSDAGDLTTVDDVDDAALACEG